MPEAAMAVLVDRLGDGAPPGISQVFRDEAPPSAGYRRRGCRRSGCLMHLMHHRPRCRAHPLVTISGSTTPRSTIRVGLGSEPDHPSRNVAGSRFSETIEQPIVREPSSSRGLVEGVGFEPT